MNAACTRRQAEQEVEGACKSFLRKGEIFILSPFRTLGGPFEGGSHASSSGGQLTHDAQNLQGRSVNLFNNIVKPILDYAKCTLDVTCQSVRRNQYKCSDYPYHPQSPHTRGMQRISRGRSLWTTTRSLRSLAMASATKSSTDSQNTKNPEQRSPSLLLPYPQVRVMDVPSAC